MDINEINKLWRYLKIQDDEVLIVEFYDHDSQSCKYIVSNKIDSSLEIKINNELPDFSTYENFRFIQQAGSDGKSIIPSVKQLIEDEYADY